MSRLNIHFLKVPCLSLSMVHPQETHNGYIHIYIHKHMYILTWCILRQHTPQNNNDLFLQDSSWLPVAYHCYFLCTKQKVTRIEEGCSSITVLIPVSPQGAGLQHGQSSLGSSSAYQLKDFHPAPLKAVSRRKQQALSTSHSPCHTVGNRFSCDLLFRLEAQHTESLPFFGVCIAGVGEQEFKAIRLKRNSFSPEDTLGLFYSQISPKAEIHKYAPSPFPTPISSTGEFPNCALCFLLKWSPPFMATAELKLSRESRSLRDSQRGSRNQKWKQISTFHG